MPSPAATAVTMPAPLTVATLALLDVQVIVRPPSGLPLASRGVASSCWVAPTLNPNDVGESVTLAAVITGAGDTETTTVAVWPSTLTTILAVPAEIAVISPMYSRWRSPRWSTPTSRSDRSTCFPPHPSA